MSKFYRKKSGINNWGLFAGKNFNKGDKVIEYKGKPYTHKQVEEDDRFDNSKAIYLFTLNKKIVLDGDIKSNTAKYINTNAGRVHYDKGEIILYPVNIVSTSLLNRIEIEAVPESNDILAKENMYIVLDTTGNSVLTLKEDLMASGSNRSGTIYIPPSSFSSYRKFTR